jgi:hypothetical protein
MAPQLRFLSQSHPDWAQPRIGAQSAENQQLQPRSTGQNQPKPAVAVRRRTPLGQLAEYKNPLAEDQNRLVTKEKRRPGQPAAGPARGRHLSPQRANSLKAKNQQVTSPAPADNLKLKLNIEFSSLLADSCQTLKPSKKKG